MFFHDFCLSAFVFFNGHCWSSWGCMLQCVSVVSVGQCAVFSVFFSDHSWSGSFCMLQCISLVNVGVSAFVCQWPVLVCLQYMSVIIAGLSVFVGFSGLSWLSALCASVCLIGHCCSVCFVCFSHWCWSVCFVCFSRCCWSVCFVCFGCWSVCFVCFSH